MLSMLHLCSQQEPSVLNLLLLGERLTYLIY